MSIYEPDTLSQVLGYVAQGWHVFPVHSIVEGRCTCGKPDCDRPAKHPRTAHGLKDATTDPEQIRRWHEQYQGRCNWAIATGAASGIWSLDDDDQGQAIERLESQDGALPMTPRFRTGGGGEQRLFRWADGVKNKVKILPGLDVRGKDGYIIVPPSLHASGRRYEWLTVPDTPLPDAPATLLKLICENGKAKAPAASGLVVTISPATEDLSNHPGAGEGERNRTLCQLAGIHLARGDSLATVDALALAWAERCDPPYSEAEVRRTLCQLQAKHQRQQQGSQEDDDVEDLRTNEESSTPVNTQDFLRSFVPAQTVAATTSSVVNALPELHADAYHGLPGEIVRAVTPETEADPAAILFQFLVAVGNALGRGPHFCVGMSKHHTNLFTLVVGDTASAKGQSLDVVMSLMEHADPVWNERCLCHGLSSGEGLIESVRDAKEEGDVEDADNGLKVNVNVTDEGAVDKRLLAIETEFAGPTKLMRREGNILSPLLRNAWDGKPLEVRNRKRNAMRATNAHIGVIGHITPEELDHEFGGKPELANGFSNRFLFCRCWRRKLLPFGGNAKVLLPFIPRLAQALVVAKRIGECQRSEAADRLWADVYPSLAESKSGAYGKAVERGRPQVMRLAMIYALLDGKAIIDVAHLRAGLAVWAYADGSAKLIFAKEINVNNKGESGEESLGMRLLSTIEATPGLSRTGLHDALGRNRKADEVAAALAWLEAQGLAHPAMTPTGGRPCECWYPGLAPLIVDVADASTNERRNEESSDPMPEASPNEETKERINEESPSAEPTDLLRSFVPADAQPPQTQDLLRSFVPGPMSLLELVQAVNALPGRFVWRAGSVVVDADDVPDGITQAVQQHQAELVQFIPPSQETAIPAKADENEMTEEEFMRELSEMQPYPTHA